MAMPSVKSSDAAADNSDIKGIFLHVSTPGGTVFGSMAIHEAIQAYKAATGNPVLVYIEGLSASGGVMSMVGADAIYADIGSFIGSIGVIGGTIVYYDQPKAFDGGLLSGGVTTEGGIEQTIISAGRSKDLGNPFRRITDQERAVLQEGVDTLYNDFVNHVAVARDIDPLTIVTQMGAQIFENSQAEKFGLIDGTRSWNQSIGELAGLAGLADDYRLVQPNRPSVSAFESIFLSKFWEDAPSVSKQEFETLVRSDICAAMRFQKALVYDGPRLSGC